LPADKKERQSILQELPKETRTIVIYEAPHRLRKTLTELYEILGNRRIALCRELTKKYETAFRTTLEEAISYYEAEEPRGECVLVIEGKKQKDIEKERREAWEELSLEEHMGFYEDKGIPRKEAMRLVAKDRGLSKRDVYQALLRAEE